MQSSSSPNSHIKWYVWLLVAVLGTGLISFLLALASIKSVNIQSWLIFYGTSLLCMGIIAACWWAVQSTEGSRLPTGLLALVLLSVVLRLGAGVLWYRSLPVLGHDSPAEQSGYVMADAYQRDKAAWEFAQSEKPLTKAFRNQRAVDQYGGLLFASALIYRYIGGDVHQPLQMVLISAAASSLAVLFTWVLARRIWSQKVAWIAAWFLVLFPEALLLGSSQMREAFSVTLVVMAFYGLVGFIQKRSGIFLIWTLTGVLLLLPFSPPLTALLVVLLGLASLFTVLPNPRKSVSSRGIFRQRRVWIITAIVVILVLVGVWFTLGQFAPDKVTNPISMVSWWLGKSADWQAHLTERASGKIQAIFDRTPEWSHAYLLLAYGIAQPLLPAALVVTSQAPIWQGIAIWRAAGWTIVLILLLYASFRAFSKDSGRMTRILVTLIWIALLVASFRGGGDQWDNPRYRTTFSGIAVAIAAWAWVTQRQSADRLFRYALVWVVMTMLWFLPWYLQREFHIPWIVGDSFKTLALGTTTAVLVIIWDWAHRQDHPTNPNI